MPFLRTLSVQPVTTIDLVGHTQSETSRWASDKVLLLTHQSSVKPTPGYRFNRSLHDLFCSTNRLSGQWQGQCTDAIFCRIGSIGAMFSRNIDRFSLSIATVNPNPMFSRSFDQFNLSIASVNPMSIHRCSQFACHRFNRCYVFTQHWPI